MRKNNLSRKEQERDDLFLRLSAAERTDIRAEIASVLPAYNNLLEMRALTFEEFALQEAAKEQGLDYTDPLFSYEKVMPACPKCKTHRKTKKIGTNMYVCGTCKMKFAANYDSISSGTRCSSLIWLKILHDRVGAHRHPNQFVTHVIVGVLHTVHSFARPQSVCTISIADIVGAVGCSGQFPAIGPPKGPPGAVIIACRVADGIVCNRLAVILRQQVAPAAVTVGVRMASGTALEVSHGIRKFHGCLIMFVYKHLA